MKVIMLQDHLRRREQERADAEVRREVHRVRTASPAPQTNRLKSCTYERPWAQGAPDTKKVLTLHTSTVLQVPHNIVCACHCNNFGPV